MSQPASLEAWIAAMARAANGYGLAVDIKSVRQQMRWYEQLPAPRRLERLGHLMGLSVSLQPREKVRWRNEILPR